MNNSTLAESQQFKIQNSKFKTLIAPAIHSPPSLDLWSLARARREGESHCQVARGWGFHIFFPMTNLINPPSNRHDTVLPLPLEVTANAWAVDAACSGNPGPMEYQAIDLATGAQVFHYGPVHGTNNIGEFLAIVHALALLDKQGITGKTIYSDSRNAILWVKKRQCKTKLERTPQTAPLYAVIARAEAWLRAHPVLQNPVVKWETRQWGEVPADFGRK